ncbi:signal peptide peptidase [Ophiostoma piceae UAMH 11346]|uniref:Signal peptide peptidase n=1 Tax=Ophiostoma piceae (strain UAMH 11346) TaxID=1262450 RepID=S3C4P8_OPHP1|nr:signal peptide peptidase [Ophiostoma piceae UAMH 11346]
MASNETVAALAGTAASTAASPELAGLAGSLNPAAILRYIIDNPNMWVVNGQIYAMAVAVIYAAAHASLARPPSAAPDESDAKNADGTKKDKSKSKSTGQELRLTDALMLPVMGSCVLGGLYYLLKYLDDPSIISRILRGNVVLLSVVSGGAMFGATLHLGASVVFPNVWTSRDGRRVYRIDAAKRQQSWATIHSNESSDEPAWTEDATRSTPFPDSVARLVPKSLVPTAWSLRSLLRKEWTLAFLMKLGAEEEEAQCTVFSIAGVCFSIVVSILYLFYSNVSRPGVLNNLMGIGTCFVSLPQISGTSFIISSVVMLAMFVYDLVMVFYTPLMITVASSVQAPLMIAARSGSRRAMLGLGDIAVPGIFICLCLRYDLYRFYASKIQSVETALETETETVVDGEYITSVSTVASTREVKAAYVDPSGHWGDWLWTGALSKSYAVAAKLTPGVAASTFPKPFFYMSMASYLFGLMLANAAVEYTQKGQPALFYLVPVMLLATWGQGAYTGNLKDMWNYTESGSLDTKDVVVDVDAKAVKEEEGKQQAIEDTTSDESKSTGLTARELRAQKRAQRESS